MSGPIHPVHDGQDAKALEGEYFVDVAEKPIPPKDTWEELNFNQLLEVQLQLENKLLSFAKNPVISKSLLEALDQLQALIALRSSF